MLLGVAVGCAALTARWVAAGSDRVGTVAECSGMPCVADPFDTAVTVGLTPCLLGTADADAGARADVTPAIIARRTIPFIIALPDCGIMLPPCSLGTRSMRSPGWHR